MPVRLRAVASLAVPLVAASSALAAPQVALPPVVVGAEEPSAARVDGLDARLADALRDGAGLEVTPVSEARADGARASEVRRWALESGADGVVTGRVEQGVLWLELRSAHSGGLLGGWSLSPALPPAELEPALADIRRLLGAPPLGRSAGAPGDGEEGSGARSLVAARRSEGPISIKSAQLDVVSSGGRRHLVFTDDVIVTQGDIELRADRLDAFYDEGQSQPQKLVAKGRVRVVQGERTAQCEQATYLRAQQLVVCAGRAELVQGCDVVRGSRIEFDLEREHFTVMGAASVVLGRDEPACGGGGQS
jgi:lipopolysaccharide export system protein LptA